MIKTLTLIGLGYFLAKLTTISVVRELEAPYKVITFTDGSPSVRTSGLVLKIKGKECSYSSQDIEEVLHMNNKHTQGISKVIRTYYNK